MSRKIKEFPVATVKVGEVKADPELGDVGEFEAIVSVFGNIDEVGDRVVEGAFAATLKEWEAKSADGFYIPVWYSHQYADPENLIGRVVEAAELAPGDDRLPVSLKDLGGLWIKGALFIDRAARAKKVHGDFTDGVLAQFSFAYDVVKEKRQNGANELLELVLHEVGPTPLGANRETRLVAVKNAAGAYELASEKAWIGVAGSVEERQRRLDGAVRDWAKEMQPGNDYVWAGIEATFDDRVVATIEGSGEMKTYEIAFSIAENGAVTLGEASEVSIVGVIEPKDRVAAVKAGRVLNAKNETLLREAGDRLAAVLKSLEAKTGRTLSAANEAKIRSANDLVEEVLSALDDDDGGKSGNGRGNVDELEALRMRLDLQRAKAELAAV
jgi:HK97 family phage prohead protease